MNQKHKLWRLTPISSLVVQKIAGTLLIVSKAKTDENKFVMFSNLVFYIENF